MNGYAFVKGGPPAVLLQTRAALGNEVVNKAFAGYNWADRSSFLTTRESSSTAQPEWVFRKVAAKAR
jgi:hypothetical protein